MKISKLQVQNFLGIKEFKFEPKQINLIRGANEAGKTTLLETIEKALYNKGRRVKYVKTGEEEANLLVELDSGFAVNRTLRDESGKDKVSLTKDGYTVPRPEGTLKSLIGTEGFQFNPVDFLMKKDAEQVEILLSLMPIALTEEMLEKEFDEVPPVNTSLHALKVLKEVEKYYYNKRHLANAEVKTFKKEIEILFNKLPEKYDVSEWENVNIGELWKRVTNAQDANSQIEKALEFLDREKELREAIQNRFAAEKAEIEKNVQRHVKSIQEEALEAKNQILKQIAELEAELVRVTNRAENNVKDVKASAQSEIARVEEQAKFSTERLEEQLKFARETSGKKMIDIAPLQEEAEHTEKMKAYVHVYRDMQRVETQYKEAKDIADRLDYYVQRARELPAELLHGVELPVAGLSVDADGNVLIHELPIQNLSDSQKITLCLEVAAATCGELKVICIDRFESLDPKKQEAFLKEAAQEKYAEFQFFITDISRDYDEDGNYLGDLRVETYE